MTRNDRFFGDRDVDRRGPRRDPWRSDPGDRLDPYDRDGYRSRPRGEAASFSRRSAPLSPADDLYDEDGRRPDRARAALEAEAGYRFGRPDNRRYGNEDEYRIAPMDETDRLISSTKVEGTPVFNPRGERIGSIRNFMVTKRSGRVEYVLLSFGGFMGLGDRYFPLDWERLDYSDRLQGYVVDLSRDELERMRRLV